MDRVVVTGHRGYLGSVLCPVLRAEGHVVHGLDAELTPTATIGPVIRPPVETTADIRDVDGDVFDGATAVIHLAGLSNDPLGEVDPALTDDINHRAAVRLARLARGRGVERFVFASSCSLYGASDGSLLDERSPLHPVSAYARAKATAEREILGLADATFAPVALRLATLYGPSPALRTDLVLNRLSVIGLYERHVALDSDGASWRPLVHVLDVAEVIAAVLRRRASVLAGRAWNVVGPGGNMQMEDLARLVGSIVPDALTLLDPGRPQDPRSYRVSGRRLVRRLRHRPRRLPAEGTLGLLGQLTRWEPSLPELLGPGHVRLAGLRSRLADGRLGVDLRSQVAHV